MDKNVPKTKPPNSTKKKKWKPLWTTKEALRKVKRFCELQEREEIWHLMKYFEKKLATEIMIF